MRDIPRPQWPTFFSNFGYRHFGWSVILEHKLRGREGLTEDHCFLEEVVTERATGHQQITIVLGCPFHSFKSYIIANPTRVCVAARCQHTLKIEAGNGSYTGMRLRQPDLCGYAA